MRRADLVARFSQAVDVEKAESLVDKGARTVGLPSTETYTSQNVADICEAIEQQTEGYLRLLATEIRVSERTQERFDALLEQVTDPVVTVRFEDETPVVAAMNPAFRETFGYGSAAIDQRLDELIVPEDVAEPVEPWLSPHTGDGQEAQRLTDDGERRTFLLRTVVVTRETGRVEGYGIYTDITERKERELELERYETMLNRAGDIVYATDPDGYLTAVNDAATAFLSFSREELVGAHVSLVMDDTDVATGEALIRELLTDEDRDQGVFEMDLVTSDGERIPCEDHIQLLVSDGEFQGIVGVVRDITERKEYENTLEALHETTRALFRCKTRDEVARQTAAAAKSVLGYPTNVVRLRSVDGTSLQPVAVTEDAKAVYGKRPTYAVGEGPVGEVYVSGRTRVCEDVQQLDDGFDRGDARAGLYVSLGEYGTLSINSTAVDAFDQTDVQLAELLATNVEAALDRAADERELSERTQELRRQNERLDEFASVLLHDLRNPLNVAQGRLDLAQRECDSEHLDSVAQAQDRMETLIQDVLTLTRQGRSVGETTTVSVATVAEAAWDHVETDEATVEITGSQEIEADESRLRQLFENLFRNAVEHASDACTVPVGTLDDPPGFYVADDGPGIPSDERDTVFESGYSTASEGTGFGLSIVKQIAEAHGWEVNVTASDRGGARFEIRGTSSANQQDD
ncbi:PAS domain S-box protein [Haloplanus halophilus]|uniref:sensor histidine kinase n=1 Tax=Haloplanus halophilus TaxID=2949993 RepID=UPI003CCE05CD